MSAKAWRPQAATQMCDEQEGKAEEMMVGPKKRIGRGHPQHRMLRMKEEAGGSRSMRPERGPMGNNLTLPVLT